MSTQLPQRLRSSCPVVVTAAALLALAGCEDRQHASEPYRSAADDTPLEHAAKHLDALYRCPMHPQITSDRPGPCPICRMNLIRVEPRSLDGSPREPIFYRNPMDPTITSPVPRKDEMGMDYVPVYADELEGTLEIAPAVLQKLGVRYATAERSPLPVDITAVGYVRYDERTIREVRIRAEGWVERLTVRAAGDPVSAGQRLFEVYSPMIATAEAELEQAIAFGDQALIAASERRLAAFGVDRATIARLSTGGEPGARLAFVAPVSGIVDQLEVREGARVAPDTLAMRIIALDPIWVIVEVSESNLSLVRTGAAVELDAVALPGGTLTGTVDYVYPELDPRTRTGRVRIVLANLDAALLPDMYVSARIAAPEGEPVVHVPLESVIRGGRSDRVIVALGEGRFEAREVRIGRESEERIAITSGLEARERVVASGVFLIDSEATLRSSLARMSGAAADPTSGREADPDATQSDDHSRHMPASDEARIAPAEDSEPMPHDQHGDH